MLMTSIDMLKKSHRQNLAALSFDAKIAILIQMQKIAREMALSSGRPFKGVVWCEENVSQPFQADRKPVVLKE